MPAVASGRRALPHRGRRTERGGRGRGRCDKYRRLLWKRAIRPLIGRQGVAHGSGVGKTRWVVERTFAWLHQFKRLPIRNERRAGLHHGFLQLACCIICLRRLQASSRKDQ
ncbi:transposase [Streptomyces sp. NPDC054813]